MNNEIYKEIMIGELQKFINVYNQLANTSYLFDIEKGQYDYFIRLLGNYIYKVYTPEGWKQSKLSFSDDIFINFSIFVGTEYEDKVGSYLNQLKEAFNDSLDKEIDDYLTETSDYTENEKMICREFYQKVSMLHAKMKENMFRETDTDLTSKDNISNYKTELEEYNRYMNYVAGNKPIFSLITHFDTKIRNLAQSKQPRQILFDV